MALQQISSKTQRCPKTEPKVRICRGHPARCFAREVAHGLTGVLGTGSRGQAQSPLFDIGGNEMIWLSKVGIIATVCVLVFRPDIVTAFWATVTIVFVIYVVIDLFGEWIDRILLGKNSRKENRRTRRGRRKEDRVASS